MLVKFSNAVRHDAIGMAMRKGSTSLIVPLIKVDLPLSCRVQFTQLSN